MTTPKFLVENATRFGGFTTEENEVCRLFYDVLRGAHVGTVLSDEQKDQVRECLTWSEDHDITQGKDYPQLTQWYTNWREMIEQILERKPSKDQEQIVAIVDEIADMHHHMYEAHYNASWGDHGKGSMAECGANTCRSAIRLQKLARGRNPMEC